jgi:hypothetical protein
MKRSCILWEFCEKKIEIRQKASGDRVHRKNGAQPFCGENVLGEGT